jgi:hypothetical protein
MSLENPFDPQRSIRQEELKATDLGSRLGPYSTTLLASSKRHLSD